jgi:ketosteroid isomerase-like protein
MSNGSAERVQAAVDAYLRGDQAEMLALVSPDVVITQFPDQIDVRDYHGHEGLLQVMSDWLSAWEDWRIEILTVREIADLVFAGARQSGRGKGSGAPMDSEVVFVFTVGEGKVTRWQMFRSEQEAFAAMGVSP